MTRLRSIAVIIALTIVVITSSAIATPYANSRAVVVSGGEDHTLVLTADANLWACGDNGHYQLGIGNTTTDQELLVRVHGVNDVNLLENIISADAGWKHSLAVDINYNVLAWGRNDEGQLGDDQDSSPYYSGTPVLVHKGEMWSVSGFLENIVAVSAGRSGEFSLALDDANHVFSWGMNDDGQLGDGSKTDRTTPVQVKGGQMGTTWLENIACISAGEQHSAAVDLDGIMV